jgi:hypothetical protein
MVTRTLALSSFPNDGELVKELVKINEHCSIGFRYSAPRPGGGSRSLAVGATRYPGQATYGGITKLLKLNKELGTPGNRKGWAVIGTPRKRANPKPKVQKPPKVSAHEDVGDRIANLENRLDIIVQALMSNKGLSGDMTQASPEVQKRMHDLVMGRINSNLSSIEDLLPPERNAFNEEPGDTPIGTIVEDFRNALDLLIFGALDLYSSRTGRRPRTRDMFSRQLEEALKEAANKSCL